jgi:hypothetical protein
MDFTAPRLDDVPWRTVMCLVQVNAQSAPSKLTELDRLMPGTGQRPICHDVSQPQGLATGGPATRDLSEHRRNYGVSSSNVIVLGRRALLGPQPPIVVMSSSDSGSVILVSGSYYVG